MGLVQSLGDLVDTGTLFAYLTGSGYCILFDI